MRLREYIKDRGMTLFICFMTLCAGGGFMAAVGVEGPVIWAVCIICLFGISLSLGADYMRRRRFYQKVNDTLRDLDEKSYLTALLERPGFFDGRFLYDILKKDEKYFNDKLSEQRQSMGEYKDYVQTWVHEVKTPIATSKLLVENHKDEVTLSIEEEIEKIDSYVEQMLYFSKSESLEEDYRIQRVALKEMVTAVLKKNAKVMIQAGIGPRLSGLEVEVLTDPKWTEFIMNQILSNSLKYRAADRDTSIEFFAEILEGEVRLTIRDNGIGIDQADLGSVFRKGFTGANGRKFKRSTGMGLYLVKKLCEKMEIPIELESTEGVGTSISLIFRT